MKPDGNLVLAHRVSDVFWIVKAASLDQDIHYNGNIEIWFTNDCATTGLSLTVGCLLLFRYRALEQRVSSRC